MKKTLLRLTALAVIFTFWSCADDTNPEFRVLNERSTKANVQIQTSGGNTINLNDVQASQVTAFQPAAEGYITATASIQDESVSPSIRFFAKFGEKLTIVIQTTTPPSLRVDR